MKETQRIYSYRKFKGIGLASAVVGLTLFGMMIDSDIVHADSVSEQSNGGVETSDKVLIRESGTNKTIDKSRIEKIPVTTRYVGDDNLDYGQIRETPGVEGEKRITTTYTVDPDTGALTNPVEKTDIIKPMTQTVVTVGTKSITRSFSQPSGKNTYVKDPDSDVGSEPVTNNAISGDFEGGKFDITYTFEVNPDTGAVHIGRNVNGSFKAAYFDNNNNGRYDAGIDELISSATVYNPVESDYPDIIADPRNPIPLANDNIVFVGARPKVVETPIPFATRYEKDNDAPKGKETEVTPGVAGKTVTTTTYKVDPNTGNVTENPSTSVTTDPVTRVVKVGTQPKVEETPIPFVTRYEKDDEAPKGKETEVTPGVAGKTVTTTTYEVDPNTGKVTENPSTPVTTDPVTRVVKVGTQPKVEETPIPFVTRYEKDDEAPKGKETEVTPGVAGKTVTTTTYEVDPNTGKVTENPSTPVTTDPVTRVVKVGTQPKVEETPIPFVTRYEKDNDSPKGKETEVTPGVAGKTVTTTTYEVDPNTGKVTENPSTPVTTDPVTRVVKVGTQPKVEETPIPFVTRYEKDNDSPKGKETEVTPGVAGKTVTTTNYEVDPNTGKVTENPSTSVTTDPVTRVVKVGTQPKVEIIRDGGDTVQRTTSHDVDPKTGVVTSNTKDDLIARIPANPPTVEIPEYTDPIGGAGLDGEGGIVPPPTVEIPEYTDPIGGAGLDGEGGIVPPTAVDIPEYTDPIGGAGLDGEGNIVTPPTVEIPEYTGAIGGSLDGEGSIVTPPTVDIPEYTETEQPQTLKPEITPPTVDKPEYTDPIGGAGLDGEGNVITPPTVDKPVYNGDIEPTIDRKVLPAGKRYEKDSSREKGQPDITIPGKDGSVTTTFHYHVDKDGNVVSSKGSSVTDEPISTIIKVAAKDKVEVKVVESPKRYVGDDTKELGYESGVFGKHGVERVTTIYDVNPETGEITERTEKELSVVPTETVITKGTKPTVKTVERDGKVYEQTTTYTVNGKTGEVTSSTTEKLIKDVETPEVKPAVGQTDKPVEKTEQKQLPNTGDAGAIASLAGLGIGLLGVRLGRKREE